MMSEHNRPDGFPSDHCRLCCRCNARQRWLARHDVNRAVNAARKAFDEGPWRRMNAAERGRLMHKLADLVEKNLDELANLEALDNGKPASIAKIADIPLVVNTLRYYAGWADKIHGKTLPIAGPYFAYTKEEPVGVCG